MASMRALIPFLLVLFLLLAGCWSPTQFEDLDLTRTPFSTHYVDRDDAILEVRSAEGYVCPDGSLARIYFVDPVGVPAEPRPLAVLFHGRAFDYIDSQDENYAEQPRLTNDWAVSEVETMLGLRSQGAELTSLWPGTWAALLLAEGWSLVAPANCWGDLWHGRGDNNFAQEDFLRYGAYFASDAIRLARERPDIHPQRLLAVGIGEGGRAITELILDGVALDGAAIDSSPDWLAPVVTTGANNRRYVTGLLRIYDGEVGGIEDAQEQYESLRTALRRDSMVHVVEELGFRTPIVYGYSAFDERIDVETSRPAADTIGALYPPGGAYVVDWGSAEHAPSNTHLELAQEALVDFLLPSL
jgi:hypothetical protein